MTPSTTRPTARPTGTGPTTTGPGTAGWGSQRRPRGGGAPRPAVRALPTPAAVVPGAAAVAAATSSAAPRVATTTPTARTTPSPGSTGPSPTTSCWPSPDAWSRCDASTRCSPAPLPRRDGGVRAGLVHALGQAHGHRELDRPQRQGPDHLPRRRRRPDLAEDGALLDDDFLVLINGWWEPLQFRVPEVDEERTWRTELDAYGPGQRRTRRTCTPATTITLGPQSIAVLIARPGVRSGRAYDAAARLARPLPVQALPVRCRRAAGRAVEQGWGAAAREHGLSQAYRLS